MMNPDSNESVNDKNTLETSPATEPENKEAGKADSAKQVKPVAAAAPAEPISENTNKSSQPSVQMGKPDIELPANNPGNEELAQSSDSETSLQDLTSPAEQAEKPSDDTSRSNESVNTEAPAAKVASIDVGQIETRTEPAPVKRPRSYIDITPYLKLMVDREASDMYFTCGAKVQIKINGVSLGIGNNALPKGSVKDILPGILNKRQMKQFEEEMELDTAFSVENVGRFRINVFRQRGEVALVIRQIKAQIPSVKELNLPQSIENLIMEPRGLIIIAGATGTGKSTTVASMIDYRNSRRSGHILTIEDPIEFIHDHKMSIVNQREVGLDTKSFKEALRRAMREAPDVIMIGEIRDAETLEQALSYADTGHLCIATLHATNTTQCMERIIGMFPKADREQLLMDISLNLRAIVCQRLLIGTDKARVPATEVLMTEPLVKKIIRDGETHKLKEILEKAPPESPLHSFDNDMLRLYQAKKISMQQAMSHADEPDHFKLKINLGGSGLSTSADDIYSV